MCDRVASTTLDALPGSLHRRSVAKFWEDPLPEQGVAIPMGLSASTAHLLQRALHLGYVDAKIRCKRNAKGELVIALILPEKKT